MADIIHLLSDHIANQIAAGEVIQRPSSAVKELMENAVDAGATEIQLIVQDAGKLLVQVTDNGCGMSETDARMCFERHATSKIQQIDDLFHIRTMGFRGEALASIAAVAQVEIKTRKTGNELGTYLEIDNSIVKKQEPCQCQPGTSIAMKNLFFNVPARRNFLKSNASELRHILEEFTRVALAFPPIFFSLHSNGETVFHLEKGSLKQRIVQLLGSQYGSKLVTVKESTEYMNIYGFVGKPDTAKKTRGDQFFFVNNRFIRSAYLNHAVMSAFSEMIPKDSFPLYILFIELDPEQLDVNVHPTKQEIKFEDERVVYAFVQSAVKHALAQFSITPTLDFDLPADVQQLPSVTQPFTEQQQQDALHTSIYKTFTRQHQAHLITPSSGNLSEWKSLYEIAAFPGADIPAPDPVQPAEMPSSAGQLVTGEQKPPVQIHQQYILQQIKSGFILIDQQAAHEKVLYDIFRQALQEKPMAIQQCLFPQTITLPPSDAALLQDMLEDLKTVGYDIAPFGQHTFVLQGVPADLPAGNEANTIEKTLEQFKHFNTELKIDRREKLLRSLARQQAVKPGVAMDIKEMQHLIDQLFACSHPQTAPSGNSTYITFRTEELEKMFGK